MENQHTRKPKTSVGDKFLTKNYGEAEVIEYNNCYDVLVRFDNGHEQRFQLDALRKGIVRNKSIRRVINSKAKQEIKPGDIFRTKNCGDVVVVLVLASDDVEVEFSDGYRKRTYVASLKSGAVQNPNTPSVYGVGFIAEDEHSHHLDRTMTREYNLWSGMMTRCYNPKYHEKKPTYKDVIVCDEWLHFTNFKNWLHSQPEFHKEGWEIDKDILKKGNKVYCPEFCVFVPPEVNSQLTKANSRRGDYPIGVSWHKQHEKFMSCIREDNKTKHLGYFHCPEKAFNAYKVAKENYLKVLAEKYKQVIDVRVYNALYAYEVEITD